MTRDVLCIGPGKFGRVSVDFKCDLQFFYQGIFLTNTMKTYYNPNDRQNCKCQIKLVDLFRFTILTTQPITMNFCMHLNIGS